MRPPIRQTVTEWAESNRKLSSERSASPGDFRAWAFQREPMDVLSAHDPTEFIVLMCASQMLKTTAYENAIGSYIANDPGPILLIQPREADTEEFSKKSIDPMFRDCPTLAGLVAVKKSREAGNTINEKRFRGGSLTMLGAQTPENFQMRSIRYALGDEVDRWPREVGKEGSTVRLFIMRTANFRRIRKVALASTPTLEGDSVIFEWWTRSDQRKYHVPCPLCGAYQVLIWERVKWGADPAEAWYECELCHGHIENWRKPWMIDRGEWVKGNPKSKIAGFHLPRLYSLITPWGELAEDFIASKDDPGELKSFINTKLAELWKITGDAPDWEIIASRASDYEKGTVPAGALILTAGVDVQRDRLEIAVWGWGCNKQRFLLDYRVLFGDTARLGAGPWLELTGMLGETWRHASGAEMSISRTAIDSGDQATQVYDWSRQQGPGRVIVVKGYDTGTAILGTPKTTESNAKRRRRGVLVYPVNVSMAKTELYGQLRLGKPAEGGEHPPGWVHHYRETDEWYKQLVAERYVQKKNKRGFMEGRWHKTGRNEALDTANYARAAAEHLGVSKWLESRWKALEVAIEPLTRVVTVARQQGPTQLQAKPVDQPKPQARPGWVQGGSSWLRR